MKKMSLLGWLLITVLGSRAQAKQTVLVVTAVEKSSVPGIVKKRISEKDNVSTATVSKSTRNIEIYLEYSGKKTPMANYVWLDGKAYALQAERMNTPVLRKTSGVANSEQVDTIVPKSKHRVWRLVPTSAFSIKGLSRPTIGDNHLVLVYTLNGKRTKTAPIPIRKLADDILQ
jgi:hypothetical protein